MKAREYEFNRLKILKESHSKLNDLFYSKLEIQNYFKLENINTNEAQTLFRYRVRMAKYGENFRGKKSPIMCPLCHTHTWIIRKCAMKYALL